LIAERLKERRPCSSFLELGRVLVCVFSVEVSLITVTKFGHKIVIFWSTTGNFPWGKLPLPCIIFYDLAKQDTLYESVKDFLDFAELFVLPVYRGKKYIL